MRGRWSQRFHELRKLPAQLFAAKKTQKQLIWVAGVQRSGTNMVMEAFDRHPLVYVAHEADARLYQSYSLKPLPEVAAYFSNKIAPYIVAKALLDADRIIELHDVFPTSKTIWPVRGYCDVVNSHMVSWPNFREQIDEIATGKEVTKWRGRNIAPETLDVIRSHYRPDISIQDCKALFWYQRNDFLFQNELSTSERMLLIRYEDFVQNPIKGTSIIADFAGIPNNASMAKGIHSRSIKKAIRPKLDSRIDTLCQQMEEKLTSAARRF